MHHSSNHCERNQPNAGANFGSDLKLFFERPNRSRATPRPQKCEKAAGAYMDSPSARKPHQPGTPLSTRRYLGCSPCIWFAPYALGNQIQVIPFISLGSTTVSEPPAVRRNQLAGRMKRQRNRTTYDRNVGNHIMLDLILHIFMISFFVCLLTQTTRLGAF